MDEQTGNHHTLSLSKDEQTGYHHTLSLRMEEQTGNHRTPPHAGNQKLGAFISLPTAIHDCSNLATQVCTHQLVMSTGISPKAF